MVLDYLQDAFFAAIAAIGFAAISNPPKRAYIYCAIIAAVGHCARYALMNGLHWHIAAATSAASLLIGILAVLLSPKARIPSETCLYPALLPMIPGVYAYRMCGALAMCLLHSDRDLFANYFYLFASNGLTTFTVLLGMVIGATLPMFLMQRISFTATRQRD